MTSVLESQLEGFFVKRVKLMGGMTIKLAPTEAGIPDRLVLMPGGRMFLVELKRDGGEVSKIQRVWHSRADALGTHVWVVYGVTGVVAWVRAVVSTSRMPNSTLALDSPSVH